MYTVVETEIFQQYASAIWSDVEREELIKHILFPATSYRAPGACAKCATHVMAWANVAVRE